MYVSAMDFKGPTSAIYSGPPKQKKADCTLTMSDENMVKMLNGKLDAQQVINTLKFSFRKMKELVILHTPLLV